jgi:hypothetical protein
VTEDGQYVIIDISQDCDPVNLFYYCELSKIDLKTLTAPIPVVKLIDEFRAKFSYVTNEVSLIFKVLAPLNLFTGHLVLFEIQFECSQRQIDCH